MLILAVLFLAPIVWWWHGPQVADMRHSHFVSKWPLSHAFSLNQGFHFLGLEIFYLCPVFFVLLVFVMWRLGRELWEESRYGLLACLALPGLVWQSFSAFFQEGRFELVPALFLPLILLAVGCALRLAGNEHRQRWILGPVFILAAAQSLAGLNPFYFTHDDGRGWQVRRTVSGENVTGFCPSKRQISWRNLADQMVQMQREVGANLIITDSTGTASALSFYMPRNPMIYVEGKTDEITQFDFWTHYDEAASPNDSALFLTRSNGNPPPDLVKDFATVEFMEDSPLLDKSWNIWNCQKFVGEGRPAGSAETGPMRESDSLPK
jgi:4-amino-4-deoxy-L-arabinose transferase-like glycosyltransferase